MLKRAIPDDGDLSSLEAAISNGEAQLWLSDESAAVTQDTVTLDLIVAAGRMDELLTMLEQAEIEARERGVSRIVCTGRAGLARALPGYRAMTVFVKEL